MGLFSKAKKCDLPAKSAKPVLKSVESFLESTRPAGAVTPLKELQARFRERSSILKAQSTSALAHLKPLHGVEKIVELRIQEWLLRKEAEERNRLREREKKLLDGMKPGKHRPG